MTGNSTGVSTILTSLHAARSNPTEAGRLLEDLVGLDDGVVATLAPDVIHDIVGWPGGPTFGPDNARPFYERLFADLADEFGAGGAGWVAAGAVLAARGGVEEDARRGAGERAAGVDVQGRQLVRALVNGPGPDRSDGLLVVGDGAQRIYPGGFTLRQAGVEVLDVGHEVTPFRAGTAGVGTKVVQTCWPRARVERRWTWTPSSRENASVSAWHSWGNSAAT